MFRVLPSGTSMEISELLGIAETTALGVPLIMERMLSRNEFFCLAFVSSSVTSNSEFRHLLHCHNQIMIPLVISPT